LDASRQPAVLVTLEEESRGERSIKVPPPDTEDYLCGRIDSSHPEMSALAYKIGRCYS
jgi:hypothetical protein